MPDLIGQTVIRKKRVLQLLWVQHRAQVDRSYTSTIKLAEMCG